MGLTTMRSHATTKSLEFETVLLGAGVLLPILAVLLATQGDLASALGFPPIPVLLVLSLGLFALHVRLRRAWTYLTTGIVASLLPLMMVAFEGGSLASPLRGAAYQGVAVMLLALLLGLPAAIAGFRRERRGAGHPSARAGWSTPHGWFALAAAGVVLGLALAGGQAISAAKSGSLGGGYDFAPDTVVTVTLVDDDFPEEAVRVPVGRIVELAVVNPAGSFHTFTYEKGGKTYNHDLVGGSTTRFLVKFDEPVTLQYWCEPHSGGEPGKKDGMVGTLVAA